MTKILLLLFIYSSSSAYVFQRYEMPSVINDFEVKHNSHEFYFALNGEDKISIRNYYMIENSTLDVGSTPYQMLFDDDYSRLFSTLENQGSVSSYNFETKDFNVWNVMPELGDHRIYEIIKGLEDDVYVSGNPGSNGSAYITHLNLSNGLVNRVNEKIIRSKPYLAIDQALGYLYAGEISSTDSLYKLDINSPKNPIILEDDRDISGVVSYLLNLDKSKIITSSGQIISTATFEVLDEIERGMPVFSMDKQEIVLYENRFSDQFLHFIDSNSFSLKESIDLSLCLLPSQNSLTRIGIKPFSHGWVVWTNNIVCLLYKPDDIFESDFE